MNRTKTTIVDSASGKGWLQQVKKVARVVGHAANVILTAPLKLPAKIAATVKYLALLAGIVEAVEMENKSDA